MLTRRSAQQGSGPVGRELGVDQRRLQLGDLGLLRLEIGLERTALQVIEQVAGLDFRAFGEKPFVQEGRDTRDYGDAVDGLDPSQKFVGLGDGALGCFEHTDRRRSRWTLLRLGGGDHAERTYRERDDTSGPAHCHLASFISSF